MTADITERTTLSFKGLNGKQLSYSRLCTGSNEERDGKNQEIQNRHTKFR